MATASHGADIRANAMEVAVNDHAIRSESLTARGEVSTYDVPGRSSQHGRKDLASATPAPILALDQALSLANQAVLRCKWQYGAALGYHSPQFASAALEHANEARTHSHRIVDRIIALGGKPEPLPVAAPAFSPSRRDGRSLNAVLREQLAAARSTIRSYRRIAAYFSLFDEETARMLGDIAAGELACAGELADLVDRPKGCNE